MITDDNELAGTQNRLASFYRIVAQICANASSPQEYHLYSNSYLAEIEQMNREIIEYLKQHPLELKPAEAA